MKYKFNVENENIKKEIINNQDKIIEILSFFSVDNIEVTVDVLKYDEFKKEFESYIGNELSKDIIGFIEDNKNKIVILNYEDINYTNHINESYEYYIKVLIHEFVHVVHSIACKHNYPETKLWEGIAVYLSNQYDFENNKGYGSYYEYGLFIYNYLKDHTKEELLKLLNVI